MKRFADSHIHMKDNDPEPILRMLDLMASIGVTDTTIHALPYRGVNQNLKALYWKSHYDGMKIRAFGSLHHVAPFTETPPLEQVKKLLALGCDGIKMMEMDPLFRRNRGFGLDDAYYEPMFRYLEEKDVPVVMHVADPETFWEVREMTAEEIRRGWFYGDGTYPSKEQITREALNVAERHPKLRITFAHFLFLSNFPEEAERVMETYPSVNFDLTPGWEMYIGFSRHIEYWHDFFVRYGDRILFGTDSNTFKGSNAELNRLVTMALTHDHSEFPMPCFGGKIIRGLELDEDTFDRITYLNYERFVGRETRPVPAGLFYAEAENMLKKLENVQGEEEAAAWLKGVLAQRNV